MLTIRAFEVLSPTGRRHDDYRVLGPHQPRVRVRGEAPRPAGAQGNAPPYLTHPANVAIILTRYGRDEYTVVAGILHDVIEDCVRDGYTRDMLEQRIGDKFGREVLDTVLAVTQRQVDDDGIELSTRGAAGRLSRAARAARTIARAGSARRTRCTTRAPSWRISGARSIRTRSGADSAAGAIGTIRWYRRVYDRLRELGFDAPIMRELRRRRARSGSSEATSERPTRSRTAR